MKNNYEDNSLKILNDKNHQASTQKFRQLISLQYFRFFTQIKQSSSAYTASVFQTFDSD